MRSCAIARRRRVLQGISITISLMVPMLGLAGCLSGQWHTAQGGMLGNAAPVVKIGLIAPFEGLDRPLGYQVLSVVKEVLAASNSSTGLGGYRVALVALNDDSDPQAAAAQAKALLQDKEVLVVVGPWSSTTAHAAAPILEGAGIPTVLAAPFADDSTLVRSLCPSPNEIAAELLREARRLAPPGSATRAGGPAASVAVAGPQNVLMDSIVALSPDTFKSPPGSDTPCEVVEGKAADRNCVVLYTGEALEAAKAVERWRAAGWNGSVLAGPDVARSWFPLQAGNAAEGTRAAVCAVGGEEVSAQPDPSSFEQAGLAKAVTETVLRALERDIAAHSRPSRSGIAAELGQEVPAPYVNWLEVKDGLWARMTP